MRSAADRAAARRGWTRSVLPWEERRRGTRVVLPAPGGASRRTLGLIWSDLFMRSRTAQMGSEAIASSGSISSSSVDVGRAWVCCLGNARRRNDGMAALVAVVNGAPAVVVDVKADVD